MMSGMAEIRKYYGVPAKRGMKVNLTRSDRSGVITGTPRQGMYLNVRFPEGHKLRLHPYDLDYVLTSGEVIQSDGLKKNHDARWDAFNARLARKPAEVVEGVVVE